MSDESVVNGINFDDLENEVRSIFEVDTISNIGEKHFLESMVRVAIITAKKCERARLAAESKPL